jgi:hypothetical protein
MYRIAFKSVVPLAGCLLLAADASAQVPAIAPDRTIAASDAASYDVFGYGLAVDGASMLVGSRGCDTPQANSGAIYAYRRLSSGWSQVQKLVFPAASRDDQIGTAVALSGSVGVAGAPGRGSSGSAFALRYDGGTWFSQVELVDAAVGASAGFGSAVGCAATTIAVGAPNSAEGIAAGAGRVRIFDRPNQLWVSGQVLTAPFPDPGDNYGSALAISGNLLAVAAPGDDDYVINGGAVYLYRRVGGLFVLTSKIVAPAPASEDWFGRSVSLSGSKLIVGAYRSDLAGRDAGAAFVYEVTSEGVATYSRVLLPPINAVNAEFGNSVSTDGTAIIVGAPGYAPGASIHGASWIYLDSDASADAMLTSTPGSSMDLTGTRVAIGSDIAVAGAPGATVGFLSSAGSVLLFDRLRDCNSNGTPDAIEIALGGLSDTNQDGTPDQCQCLPDFTGDGLVNGGDLGIMLGLWGSSVPANFRYVDLNGDSRINGADLGLLLSAWGSCR